MVTEAKPLSSDFDPKFIKRLSSRADCKPNEWIAEMFSIKYDSSSFVQIIKEK